MSLGLYVHVPFCSAICNYCTFNRGLFDHAQKAVKLEPGGLHVMFMGIKAPFKEGESFPATLNFEKAGAVDVQFNVEAFRPANQGEADSGTHKAH